MNHRIALMTLNLSEDEKRIYRFMAKSLSNAGWRVEIINLGFEGQDSGRIHFRKADISNGGFIRHFRSYKAMMKALLKSRADIAVLCEAELLKMLPKAKRIMPIQIIFDHKGSFEKNMSFYKRKLVYVDAVTTGNEQAAETIMEVYGRSCNVIRGEIDNDMLVSLCDELEKGGRYNI